MGGCIRTRLWSIVFNIRDQKPPGGMPSDPCGFPPCGLPSGQSTVMSQGGKSWQMVGSAPVEDVRTNVTREERTNVMGPSPSPTDVALADVKAGLLLGLRFLLLLQEPHLRLPRTPTSPTLSWTLRTTSTSMTPSVKLRFGWLQGGTKGHFAPISPVEPDRGKQCAPICGQESLRHQHCEPQRIGGSVYGGHADV